MELDTGWLYANTDNAAFSSATASEASFSRVCIPHANAVTKHAFQSETAFRFISWYRRHFTPPTSWAGRRFYLEFQGVSINAVVYVNGQSAGSHQGGYTPFTLDITSRVTAGQDNVIAVQVDSRQQTAVPPEGGNLDFMIYGGIVRHVNLIVTDPLHVEWIFASTQNPSQNAPANPAVTVKTRIVNSGSASKSCTVITNVVDSGSNVVASATTVQNVPANGSLVFNQTTSAISSPALWHPDHPSLYKVYTQVQDGAAFVDEYRQRIGIRSMTMNKTDGKFYINGQAIKLRGLNRHETFPFIGRAAARRLQRKDADILKFDLGCNMVRTSHYPQAPDFLDRCDEIGLLVLEEIPGWMYVGNTAWKGLEMQVLKDMIVRDRNHPSIATWGVRINESADDNAFYKSTNDTAHAFDPSRLTCGVRRSNSDPATSFLEDIWTQNFISPSANPPNMPVITSEMIGHNYPTSSWSREDTLLGQFQLHAMAQHNSYATGIWGGMLGWCAFDYASSHSNAVTLTGGRYVSPHGVADNFRIPKFAGYFFQSQRDAALYGPMVYIANYWQSSSPRDVYVASNCDQVELFVNGVSKGKINPNWQTSLPHPVFLWTGQTYAAGSLRAVGYRGGTVAATHVWNTPGRPRKLIMIPDTAALFEGGDMTRVVVMSLDSNNQFVPRDSTVVTLSASGTGDFIGESPIALEDGKTAFFVKTRASQTGTITCQASASGLAGASAAITVEKGGTVDIDRGIPRKSQWSTAPSIWRAISIGDRITLPCRSPTVSRVCVYDLSGKLLYANAFNGGTLDLRKVIPARGVHLVRLLPEAISCKQ
jgi:beta-galactosidase